MGSDFAQGARLLQFFLVFQVVATLPLAAVLSAQKRLEASLLAARDAADETAAALREANVIAAIAGGMANLGHWIYRPATQETTWSDEMYRIYGLEPADGVPAFDVVTSLFHPDDQPLVRKFLMLSLKTGEDYRLELRVMRDGETRSVIGSTTCQRAPDGSVRALVGTLMDVTELRNVETALVESEARFRTLADGIPDMVLRMTPDGVITYVTPACRQYGYEPEMLVGHRVFEFVHPEDLAAAKARSAAMFSSTGLDQDLRRETRIRTADGGWVWLEGRPTQVSDASGQVVEVVNALRDVTRRRALEDELLEARAVAERSTAAKADFLSNMSHELRTPLTAIVGFAGLLKGTGKLGGREMMFAERVATSSLALLTLVNDILDFSKIEAGGVELESGPVDLVLLIDESVAMVAGLAEKKGLVLSVTHGDDLPPILGDHTRLRQVLVNLLSNAVKFTELGSVDLEVGRAADGFVQFKVSDTGAGIPADRIEQIFDRFTQADGSTTRTHGGTGLGLAICKGLVDSMGGTLSVRSTPGVGSTFAFTLPVGVTATAAARSAA